MGLCLSADEKEDRQRSNNIDRKIEEDSRRMKRECKILLLGKYFTHLYQLSMDVNAIDNTVYIYAVIFTRLQEVANPVNQLSLNK